MEVEFVVEVDETVLLSTLRVVELEEGGGASVVVVTVVLGTSLSKRTRGRAKSCRRPS